MSLEDIRNENTQKVITGKSLWFVSQGAYFENEINMCGRNGNYRELVEAKVWSLPAVNMQNLMQSVSKIYTYIHVRFDAINCKKTSRDFEIRAFMYICIYNMYECMKQLQMAV